MSIFSRPLRRQVGIGELLVLDALLHVLVVEVEFVDAVVGAEARVVVGDDGLEGVLLLLGVVLVVFLFLRQVFLNLLHVGVALGRRREDGGDIQRDESRGRRLASRPASLEQRVVLDGVVDGGGGEQGVERASAGGGVVLGEDGVDDGALGERSRPAWAAFLPSGLK